MKILLLHNHYGSHSGESSVLMEHESLLKKYGHDVICYTRSSVELKNMSIGKIKALLSSLYNKQSIKNVSKIIETFKPDIIHIHNLYPFISPSILPVIKKFNVPILMTVHNYRLICPNGLYYNKHGVCEKCSHGKEWNCIRYNCEQSYMKSIAYAFRNSWARINGYYTNNVTAFLCLTEFQKKKLIENGVSKDKCYVLPNFTDVGKSISFKNKENTDKKSFLFIGRLNRQKGIDIIIQAAKKCPNAIFILAGSLDKTFINISDLPYNVKWEGVIDENKKMSLLNNSMALIFSSRSYEGFPMVFLEAMQYGLPVIAPKYAGYPEIIRDGKNGLLFRIGDVDDLVKKIIIIMENPCIQNTLGQNGRDILKNEYSKEVWYSKYTDVISKIQNNI
jgi:glycosyltransferase involved in cell wall biosynthesis